MMNNNFSNGANNNNNSINGGNVIMMNGRIETMDVFATTIIEALKKVYTDADVTVNEVTKNNGLTLSGLTIKTQESNIAPTIYLNGMFDVLLDIVEPSDTNVYNDMIIELIPTEKYVRNMNCDSLENIYALCKFISKMPAKEICYNDKGLIDTTLIECIIEDVKRPSESISADTITIEDYIFLLGKFLDKDRPEYKSQDDTAYADYEELAFKSSFLFLFIKNLSNSVGKNLILDMVLSATDGIKSSIKSELEIEDYKMKFISNYYYVYRGFLYTIFMLFTSINNK